MIDQIPEHVASPDDSALNSSHNSTFFVDSSKGTIELSDEIQWMKKPCDGTLDLDSDDSGKDNQVPVIKREQMKKALEHF